LIVAAEEIRYLWITVLTVLHTRSTLPGDAKPGDVYSLEPPSPDPYPE